MPRETSDSGRRIEERKNMLLEQQRVKDVTQQQIQDAETDRIAELQRQAEKDLYKQETVNRITKAMDDPALMQALYEMYKRTSHTWKTEVLKKTFFTSKWVEKEESLPFEQWLVKTYPEINLNNDIVGEINVKIILYKSLTQLHGEGIRFYFTDGRIVIKRLMRETNYEGETTGYTESGEYSLNEFIALIENKLAEVDLLKGTDISARISHLGQL